MTYAVPKKKESTRNITAYLENVNIFFSVWEKSHFVRVKIEAMIKLNAINRAKLLNPPVYKYVIQRNSRYFKYKNPRAVPMRIEVRIIMNCFS